MPLPPTPLPDALNDCLSGIEAGIDALHDQALQQARAVGKRPSPLMMVHYEHRALLRTLEEEGPTPVPTSDRPVRRRM